MIKITLLLFILLFSCSKYSNNDIMKVLNERLPPANEVKLVSCEYSFSNVYEYKGQKFWINWGIKNKKIFYGYIAMPYTEEEMKNPHCMPKLFYDWYLDGSKEEYRWGSDGFSDDDKKEIVRLGKFYANIVFNTSFGSFVDKNIHSIFEGMN